MAHIVVLGAGLGGVIMAYEVKAKLRKGDTVTVISDSERYTFVPSNPWVAVGWRKPEDITVELQPVFERRGIDFIAVGAEKLNPQANEIVLKDGRTIAYDYLVVATGPDLAFDEIEGLGPQGHTQSICTTRHAVDAGANWTAFLEKPGPIVVGAVQGASCYGPAYEFAFIM